jgi:predicted RecA/RadA family phage recombinase
MCGIANVDIAADALGALAIEGVFEVDKKTHATDEPIVAGQPVYWDVAAGKAGWDSENGANPMLGEAVLAAASTDDTVLVKLGRGGPRVVCGEAAFDGSNPTPITTGLTNVVSFVTTLKGSSAPGDNTSVITAVIGAAGAVDVYQWKNTGGTDPTLVASTGTESFYWVAYGW